MPRTFKRSPIALAVLALLHEGPMHTYKMQRLIKDRGKDQVINVEQRASLYQTINQLLRADLITLWETERQEGFPERTVYKLTEKGHETAAKWLREMLSTLAQEYPEFPAAVSLMPLLTTDEAIKQMENREKQLVKQIAVLDKELTEYSPKLPRLFLLETEYLRIMLETELKWVRGIIADIRSGQITWTLDWMRPFDTPSPEESDTPSE
jgi:DNA-binding PadR family transcriptional regulator